MFDLTAVTDTETGLVAVFIQSAQSIADIESIAFQRSSVFHAGNNAAGGRIFNQSRIAQPGFDILQLEAGTERKLAIRRYASIGVRVTVVTLERVP